MRWTAPMKWLIYRWLSRRRRCSTTPIRRVGIYKADRLGDLVLATGAIRRILEHEGTENCILITSRFSQELAQAQFPNLECVCVEPWQTNLRATREYMVAHRDESLFRHGVDRLVCLRHHRSFQETLVLSSIPARDSWGCLNSDLTREMGQFKSPSVFDHLIRDIPSVAGEARELTRHRRITSSFIGKLATEVDVTPHLESDSADAGGFAVVSPFGSASIRDFPTALLAAAGTYLWNHHRLPLCILAPPGDRTRYEALANELKNSGVLTVIIQSCSTVSQLVSAVASSKLVLSVETATAHIAAALDRPLVALLGGGHFGWFAPWQRSKKQIWLSHKVPCFQCNWVCSQPEPICITQVQDTEVRSAIDQVFTAVRQ